MGCRASGLLRPGGCFGPFGISSVGWGRGDHLTRSKGKLLWVASERHPLPFDDLRLAQALVQPQVHERALYGRGDHLTRTKESYYGSPRRGIPYLLTICASRRRLYSRKRMSAYSILLTIHSDWRWLVLLSAVFAVAVAAAGLARQLPFTPVARWASLGFIAAMDVQLLLGSSSTSSARSCRSPAWTWQPR